MSTDLDDNKADNLASDTSLIKNSTMKSPTQKLAVVLSVCLACFHLYTGVFGSLTTLKQTAVHLFFILALVYLIYPLKIFQCKIYQ